MIIFAWAIVQYSCGFSIRYNMLQYHLTYDDHANNSFFYYMKNTRVLLGIISLLMSIYFFISRFDIIREAFKLGLNSVHYGDLLLPIILFIIGIYLLTIKKKQNDKKSFDQ